MGKLSVFLAVAAVAAMGWFALGDGANQAEAAPKFEGMNASQNCSHEEGGMTLRDLFFGGSQGQCVSQVSLGHNSENGASTIVVYLCGDPNNAEALEELGFKNIGQCVSYFRQHPDEIPH